MAVVRYTMDNTRRSGYDPEFLQNLLDYTTVTAIFSNSSWLDRVVQTPLHHRKMVLRAQLNEESINLIQRHLTKFFCERLEVIYKNLLAARDGTPSFSRPKPVRTTVLLPRERPKDQEWEEMKAKEASCGVVDIDQPEIHGDPNLLGAIIPEDARLPVDMFPDEGPQRPDDWDSWSIVRQQCWNFQDKRIIPESLFYQFADKIEKYINEFATNHYEYKLENLKGDFENGYNKSYMFVVAKSLVHVRDDWRYKTKLHRLAREMRDMHVKERVRKSAAFRRRGMEKMTVDRTERD